MTLAARQEAANTVAEIIQELESAQGRSDAALLRAVPFASSLAPAVIALVEMAVDGVYLLPKQNNLLFWGIHVLAAGCCTELCGPLLRLLREQDDECLDDIFGDSITETLKRLVISVFDGNADALLAAAADRNVESYARWGLLNAIARVTFDGAIPRAETLSFLERFERESLAESGDPVWEGWQEAVIFLGFEELHDRVWQIWDDGRMPEDISDREYWERQIAIVRAMAPGDPGLFNQERFSAITDPVEALLWTPTDAEIAARKTPPNQSPFGVDPAASIALEPSESYWLAGFLDSRHAPVTAMNLEQIDGYFSALAACPSMPDRGEYTPALWNDDVETEAAPDYPSAAQAEYVEQLLARHLKAISQRLEFGYPHAPLLNNEQDEDENELGRYWAAGFIRAMMQRMQQWESHLREDEDGLMFVNALITLGAAPEALGEEAPTPKLRLAFLDKLPHMLIDFHHRWRGLPTAIASSPNSRRFGRKVGRNEPCPCGSGKKFKRCCGTSDAPAIQ
jgi:yecA family protein